MKKQKFANDTTDTTEDGEEVESWMLTTEIQRLDKDLRAASKTLSDQEVTYLIKAYYNTQDQRKRFKNQERGLGTDGKPHEMITWFALQSKRIEALIKISLDVYTHNHAMGEWMRSQKGIGPILAAALLSYIDMDQCPTVGHIWSYAGVDPTVKWEKGKKRPWNAELKNILWKIGDSFRKTSGGENPSYYGTYYRQRKAYEVTKNQAGDYAEQARIKLENIKIGKDTDAYQWYFGSWVGSPKYNPELATAVSREVIARMSLPEDTDLKTLADDDLKAGAKKLEKVVLESILAKELPQFTVLRPMLPPAHIDARASRWAVKLFLAHVHHVWFVKKFGKEPPLPYPIAILGHAHYIPPPAGEKSR